MGHSSDPTLVYNCPHLGLPHDPGLFFAYPSGANCCFHASPPSSPHPDHQAAFCLRGSFAECPAYRRAVADAHPRLPQAAKARRFHRPLHALQVAAIAISLVLLGVAGGWQFLRRGSLGLPHVHALDTPIQAGGHEFLIHRLEGGQDYQELAAAYQTSVDVIHSLNPQGGDLVVLSPGLQSADPSLPAFQAYHVSAAQSLDQLAARLNVDPSLLRRYNDCPNGCRLESGDWLLVPIVQ